MPTDPFSSEPYDNLLEFGATARGLKVHGKSKGWEQLFSNRKLATLHVSYLTQEQAARLGELKNLEKLILFNGLVNDLSALTKLKKLRHLELISIGHVKDFAFLGGSKKLETLKVADTTRFKDVSVLKRLPLLRTLEISKMVSWVRLPTLASFAALKQVRVLYLGFDTKDGSLSALARLSKLEVLHLPLSYPLEEYARLAMALPNTNCAFFSKPYKVSKSPFFKCRRCGGIEKITLVKGWRGLCPQCDDEKFRSYLKTFEEMKTEFRTQGSKKQILCWKN